MVQKCILCDEDLSATPHFWAAHYLMHHKQTKKAMPNDILRALDFRATLNQLRIRLIEMNFFNKRRSAIETIEDYSSMYKGDASVVNVEVETKPILNQPKTPEQSVTDTVSQELAADEPTTSVTVNIGPLLVDLTEESQPSGSIVNFFGLEIDLNEDVF